MSTSTTIHSAPALQPAPNAKSLPPLENGDYLTRVEFERRYEAMPHVTKAELIEGVVYIGSPVRIEHGGPHGQIVTWMGVYVAATPGTKFADNTTVRLDEDNEVQPDALLRLTNGGRSQLSNTNGYVEGAPELVVEIAASSASIDTRQKLSVYRRNHVQEYIVWRVLDSRLDWFSWIDGNYLTLNPDRDGVIESQVFPGLRLSTNAALNDDLAGILSTLQAGLTSEAHAAFVQRINAERQA